MRAVTLPASQARIVLRSRPISQADLHWVDTEDRGPSRRTVWTGTGAVRSASPGLKAQPEMEISIGAAMTRSRNELSKLSQILTSWDIVAFFALSIREGKR